MTLSDQFGAIDFVNDDDRGIGILVQWLKNSPNVQDIIQSIMPEIQELHDARKDVYLNINIFDAAGTQLDDIFGEILDTERSTGATDDEYRAELLAAVARLARSGEITVMKSAMRNLLGASSVQLFEYQPAAFKMQATASSVPSTSELATIRASLETTKQGGNSMQLAVTDKSNPFTLANLSSPQLNSAAGLNGSSFSGGGYLLEGF